MATKLIRETKLADDPVAKRLRAIRDFFNCEQREMSRATDGAIDEVRWHVWESKGVSLPNPTVYHALHSLVLNLETANSERDFIALKAFAEGKRTELPWKSPPKFRVEPHKDKGRPRGARYVGGEIVVPPKGHAIDKATGQVVPLPPRRGAQVEPVSAPLVEPIPTIGVHDVMRADAIRFVLEDVAAKRLTPHEAQERIRVLTACAHAGSRPLSTCKRKSTPGLPIVVAGFRRVPREILIAA